MISQFIDETVDHVIAKLPPVFANFLYCLAVGHRPPYPRAHSRTPYSDQSEKRPRLVAQY